MCLATPACVVAVLPDQKARVDVLGSRRVVSTELVEEVREGDFLLIHVGYALAKINPGEARETLALIASLSQEGARESLL